MCVQTHVHRSWDIVAVYATNQVIWRQKLRFEPGTGGVRWKTLCWYAWYAAGRPSHVQFRVYILCALDVTHVKIFARVMVTQYVAYVPGESLGRRLSCALAVVYTQQIVRVCVVHP